MRTSECPDCPSIPTPKERTTKTSQRPRQRRKLRKKPRTPPPQQFDQAAWWAERIGRQWGKTVADVINTGRLLLKAKDELNHEEWGYMFIADAVPKPLPFGQDYAAILMAIAKDPLLANSDNHRNLPSSVSALYELAKLPDDVLAAALQQGRVTLEIGAQAAKLGHADVQPEPEWWTESALLARTRAFAGKELRRRPAHEPRGKIGAISSATRCAWSRTRF